MYSNQSETTAKRWPRTDWFTILVHWSCAIAMVLSLATGLRISADALDATIPRLMEPILPYGDMWTVHFYAALSFFGISTAYVLYLRQGRLFGRNSLGKLRILTMQAPAKTRWGAVNVLLHWVFYLLILVLMGTGTAMYLGHGGWLIQVHRACAIATMAYIAAHVVVHFLYGGWLQLLRIFLPERLKMFGDQPRVAPAVVGVSAALLATAATSALDLGTQPRLTAAPVADTALDHSDLSRLMDNAVWSTARAVDIDTSQGANLSGAGTSRVQVKAIHDTERLYLSFTWDDPSMSAHRLPLVKQADGWHLVGTRADTADVTDFYEDKFAVLFTDTPEFGSGGTTHLGARPLPDKPAAFNGRGLHYTVDGKYHEMWQWKSTRGGLTGGMDHQYIGPPRAPTPQEAAGKARYQAGYWNYDGTAPYVYNYVSEAPGGYRGPVKLKYLPKDLQATAAAMGPMVTDPDKGVAPGQRYWMFERETVPYSADADAAIPVGTVIPGVVLKGQGEYTGARGSVHCAARWANGRWTLVASRSMKPEHEHDTDFQPGHSTYLWVAVYDHTQTRHTRHPRPVQLVIR